MAQKESDRIDESINGGGMCSETDAHQSNSNVLGANHGVSLAILLAQRHNQPPRPNKVHGR